MYECFYFMKVKPMKKFVSILIVAVFFSQSLLTSYMYAADPVPAKAAADPAPATNTSNTTNDDSTKKMIESFLRIDLSTLDAINLLQVAAYLYVYDKNGLAWFDFEKGDASQAIMTVNYFISLYAPNVWFLADDNNADDNYFKTKADAWKKAYPTEYNKVYAYVKDIQIKYTTPVAAPTPTQSPKPVPTTTPTTTQKDTKFGESCDAMYAKLMKEYESLIAIKDIEYAKIADVKDRIANVQSGKWCAVAAVAATQQSVQQENQAVVEQVKKSLNFGSANMRVIPDNIVPAYCENTNANTLRTELSYIDGEMIDSMRTDLDSLLQSPELDGSTIKRNMINFVLEELWVASSEKSVQAGDNAWAFHSMAKWLVLVTNNISNARGVEQLMNLFDSNIDKLSDMGKFIWEEFEGVKSLKTKGNADYAWNNADRKFVRTENSDGVVRFKFPSSSTSESNTAAFTIATAKTNTIQVSEKPYTWTEYQRDMSLEEFAQEAKTNGSMRGNQISASTLGKTLAQEIVAYVPDYYKYNDPNYPSVFFAEANGEQRVFKDANLTAVMPEGKFSNQRGSTYVIGKDGKLIDIFYNEEVPTEIKAKLEVDGKLIAGVEADIKYDQKAISDWYGNTFPLAIKARVYIADYILSLDLSRVLQWSTWSLAVNASIQWATICQLSLSANMDYAHDGQQGLPSIEDGYTNITQASVKLVYNKHMILADIADVTGFVSAWFAAVSQAESEADMMSALINQINQYVSAGYYLDDVKLADILPDTENLVVVQYTTNGQRESIMDVMSSYLYLLRIDHIMNFVQKYSGGWDQGYSDDTSKSPWADDQGATPSTYEPMLKVNNYSQDDQYVYVSHLYYDENGNPSDISPDKISVEVMTDSGSVSYQFESVDAYTYRAPVAHIFNDPSVSAAYIYAAYNGYSSTYYIIGSVDKPNAWYDSGYNYQEPINPYTIQWQSTTYPDVQTQEIVLSLYDNGMFVQYVEPTVVLHMTYGSDCRNNPATACTYSDINVYPTYLDSVPTYIIDTMQIDDVSVYEASINMLYVDPTWYEHNENYGLKKPQK